MPKLDELIRELCPDGVEYKPMSEVIQFLNGRAYKQTELLDNGKYKVLRVGNFYTNENWYYSDLELEPDKYCERGDLLYTWAATLGPQIWNEDKAIFHYHIWKLKFDENLINKKFLYHFLSMDVDDIEKSLTKSTMPHVSMASMNKRIVPLPPLEIQREIVRILDNFTNLTAELTAELTARKMQYSYYRDNLLSFNMPVSKKKIGEITRVFSAARVHKNEWTQEGVPFYRSSDVISKFNGVENSRGKAYISFDLYKRLSAKSGKIMKDDILITGGGTIGIPYVVPSDEPIYVKDADLLCIQKSKEFNSRFLYHYFLSTEFRKYLENITHNATIAHYTISQIENTPVPLPPLDVQNRIVNVLDNFEKICSDLNIGLPAEIEARQKQYEYYRDKLLTFAETGNTILSRAEQSRAEQSRAEQSRAEQSRAEQSRALIKLLQYVFGYAVVTLEDIAENCDSMRKPVTSGKREAGEYPYYGASGIVDYVKDYIFDGDYLLVSEDGANLLARSTPIAFSISGKNWVNNHAHVLKFDCYETRRFIEFYLNSIDLSSYISGGAQPKLNQKNLNRIEIPLPSQERQKYIVEILDRFDTICNDLTSGLPAEIEARQKQYEYYRDKLLTFKEVAAT